MVLAGWRPARAESPSLFLNAHFDLSAGYESNPRATTQSARGSAFLWGGPGVEATVLGRRMETGLELQYRTTTYADDTLNPRADSSAQAHWHLWMTDGLVGIELRAGRTREPSDTLRDVSDFAASLVRVWTPLRAPADLTVRADYGLIRYDATASEPDARTDRRGVASALLNWRWSDGLSLWSELRLEHNDSDQPSETFTGVGLRIGADWRPSPRLALGALAGGTARRYDGGSGSSATGSHWIAELRLRHRWRPWMEFTAAVGWEREVESVSTDAYSAWRAQAGLRGVFELN